MRSSQRKQTHLRYCCQYGRDTIISRIPVLHRFHICKYGSYPFLIMDRSRPYRPTHVKLLPTVTAILTNSRTKPRQISYTVVLEDEKGRRNRTFSKFWIEHRNKKLVTHNLFNMYNKLALVPIHKNQCISGLQGLIINILSPFSFFF